MRVFPVLLVKFEFWKKDWTLDSLDLPALILAFSDIF